MGAVEATLAVGWMPWKPEVVFSEEERIMASNSR
jgi:hypothetical protein